MKKLIIAICSSHPRLPGPRTSRSARVDDCAPIGQTADGKLVYSLKCNNLPKPVAPVAAAPSAESPVAEVQEEENKGGFFRFPFGSSFGATNYKQQQGVGPAYSK